MTMFHLQSLSPTQAIFQSIIVGSIKTIIGAKSCTIVKKKSLIFFSKILSREIYDVEEITTGLGDLGIENVRVKT
jgi:hypothetical protein